MGATIMIRLTDASEPAMEMAGGLSLPFERHGPLKDVAIRTVPHDNGPDG